MTGAAEGASADRISAWLDGAMTEAERRDFEARMAADPALAAEVAAVEAVDRALAQGFAEMLAEPVPLHLARAVQAAPAAGPAAALARRGGWQRIAAALALLAVGAGAGALATRTFAPTTLVAEAGWLDQVVEYHAVYAAQGRHLVEVPASEEAHLETWLSAQTGVPFTVPDLAASGLTFRGARLLVANGKPVAQLMYTDAGGQVIAVCFMARGEAEGSGAAGFAARRTDGFDLVSWTEPAAQYVVIGPAGRPDLRAIAKAASLAL